MAYKENDVKEASKATAKGSVKVRIIGGEETSMADYRDYIDMLNKKPFLTKRETVELFGIGLNRLVELMKQPDCPFIAPGGKKRHTEVHRASFEEYMRTHDIYGEV